MRDLLSPSDWGLYFKLIERALGELASIGDKQEIAVATAWLRINGTPAYKKYFLRIADQAKVPAIVVDLDKYLDTGEPIHRLLVSRAEKHPNAWAHTLIADELSKAFFADRTSPAPNTGTR